MPRKVFVSFKASPEETRMALLCAQRANRLATAMSVTYSVQQAHMDLLAPHANGCPMDFAALLAANDANFSHDVFGIGRYLNRSSGRLGDCFLPRYSKQSQTPVDFQRALRSRPVAV